MLSSVLISLQHRPCRDTLQQTMSLAHVEEVEVGQTNVHDHMIATILAVTVGARFSLLVASMIARLVMGAFLGIAHTCGLMSSAVRLNWHEGCVEKGPGNRRLGMIVVMRALSSGSQKP